MLTAIIAAEASFWVLLLGGLAARYLVELRRLSNVLLVATPLVDVVLLGLVFTDLSRGAPSEFAHGLSALYIGFSITYGHRTIRWADRWTAHRWGGRPKPPKVQHSGSELLAHQWSEWRRSCVTGGLVTAVSLAAMLVSTSGETFWLIYWAVVGVWIPLGWLFLGPLRTRAKLRRDGRDRQFAHR